MAINFKNPLSGVTRINSEQFKPKTVGQTTVDSKIPTLTQDQLKEALSQRKEAVKTFERLSGQVEAATTPEEVVALQKPLEHASTVVQGVQGSGAPGVAFGATATSPSDATNDLMDASTDLLDIIHGEIQAWRDLNPPPGTTDGAKKQQDALPNLLITIKQQWTNNVALRTMVNSWIGDISQLNKSIAQG